MDFLYSNTTLALLDLSCNLISTGKDSGAAALAHMAQVSLALPKCAHLYLVQQNPARTALSQLPPLRTRTGSSAALFSLRIRCFSTITVTTHFVSIRVCLLRLQWTRSPEYRTFMFVAHVLPHDMKNKYKQESSRTIHKHKHSTTSDQLQQKR